MDYNHNDHNNIWSDGACLWAKGFGCYELLGWTLARQRCQIKHIYKQVRSFLFSSLRSHPFYCFFFYLFLSSLFSTLFFRCFFVFFPSWLQKGCYSQEDKKGLGVLVFLFSRLPKKKLSAYRACSMRLWSVDKQKSLLHGSRAMLILVDSASVGVIAC